MHLAILPLMVVIIDQDLITTIAIVALLSSMVTVRLSATVSVGREESTDQGGLTGMLNTPMHGKIHPAEMATLPDLTVLKEM